jgi:hypothetical protein
MGFEDERRLKYIVTLTKKRELKSKKTKTGIPHSEHSTLAVTHAFSLNFIS